MLSCLACVLHASLSWGFGFELCFAAMCLLVRETSVGLAGLLTVKHVTIADFDKTLQQAAPHARLCSLWTFVAKLRTDGIPCNVGLWP